MSNNGEIVAYGMGFLKKDVPNGYQNKNNDNPTPPSDVRYKG